MPYSLSTTEKLPNVAVSSASTPTSRNAECIDRITSGRVRHSISLQPSRARPPKSSGLQVEALDERAERAVEHDDAVVHRVEVGLAIHDPPRYRRAAIPTR